MGIMSLAYIGAPHHLVPVMTCPACLPEAIAKLEEAGTLSKDRIEQAKDWIGEDPGDAIEAAMQRAELAQDAEADTHRGETR